MTVATTWRWPRSVYRGEGPVKHYVESFFTEYPKIVQGRGAPDLTGQLRLTPTFARGRSCSRRRAVAVAGDHGSAARRDAASCSTCSACLCSTSLRVGDPDRRRGARGDDRARRSACPRDLRRLRSTREPCRPDGSPGHLVSSPRSGMRKTEARWHWIWSGLAGLCGQAWPSWLATPGPGASCRGRLACGVPPGPAAESDHF